MRDRGCVVGMGVGERVYGYGMWTGVLGIDSGFGFG